MRRAAAILLLLPCLLLDGCLCLERATYDLRRIEDDDFSYEIVYRNIQSASETRADQERDWQDLLKMLHSDGALLEAAQEGRYIRDRKLAIEDGVVVARESGLIRLRPASSSRMPILERRADGRFVARIEGGDLYESSNGTWRPDSHFVTWPANAKHLALTTRMSDFRPTASLVQRLAREKAMK